MPARSVSWTRRLFERTGLRTIWVGFSLLGLLVAVFLAQEWLLARFERPTILDDIRLTLTHIVIAVYAITATVYCEQTRDESLASLRPLIAPEQERTVFENRDRDGTIVAVLAILGIPIAAAFALYGSPGSASYDPRDWGPENAWHRVLSLVMGYWTTRLAASIVIESGRLSDLATRLREIDLLDLDELSPFVRRGLMNALLIIGSVSVYALFLVDLGYLSMVLGLVVTSLGVGGLALLLPLRGVRKQIRLAKRAELGWCREQLRTARASLAAGDGKAGELQDLVAWETRVAGIHEWPVDASTFMRFALYLLIPLGSWAGGAIVERVLDALLD